MVFGFLVFTNLGIKNQVPRVLGFQHTFYFRFGGPDLRIISSMANVGVRDEPSRHDMLGH